VRSFYALGDHLAIDLPGARAVFTTRKGGFSSGPYESLNLGRWTDDRPQDVERNREHLADSLGIRFAFGRQVHGTNVRRVERTSELDGEPSEADGQATALRGVAPMALVADCLPIAVAGDGAVAMIHAGWRGLAAGIVAEGVSAVRELGCRGPLQAAIGPGAGPCCYQVGPEVHAAFAHTPSGGGNGRNLDLKAIARVELTRAGVEVVHDADVCTICSDAHYSHRRARGVTGRQAGLVWLT
jgi:YfiH family protein